MWGEVLVTSPHTSAEVLVNKIKLHSSENKSDDREKLLQWMKDYVESLPGKRYVYKVAVFVSDLSFVKHSGCQCGSGLELR